jgi:hypothetical protein
MRWLALLVASLAAFALGGCGTTDVGPSEAELKANWEAQNIPPQGYKQDLLAYMRTYLNEPGGVRGAAVSAPQRKQVGPADRYVTCVRYTERKSDGTYGAPTEGVAVYVSGKLDRFFDTPRDAREFCKDAAYAPFPELEKLRR